MLQTGLRPMSSPWKVSSTPSVQGPSTGDPEVGHGQLSEMPGEAKGGGGKGRLEGELGRDKLASAGLTECHGEAEVVEQRLGEVKGITFCSSPPTGDHEVGDGRARFGKPRSRNLASGKPVAQGPWARMVKVTKQSPGRKRWHCPISNSGERTQAASVLVTTPKLTQCWTPMLMATSDSALSYFKFFAHKSPIFYGIQSLGTM